MKNEHRIGHDYIALDRNVLAVAVINYFRDKIFDWAVYIGACPGINHDQEFLHVAGHGSKQSKEIAVMLFQGINPDKYRW